MFCIQCGAKNPDGAKFCQQCGKAQSAAAPSQKPQPVAFLPPRVSGFLPPRLEIRPRSRRNALGTVLVALLLIVLGAQGLDRGSDFDKFIAAVNVVSGIGCLWLAWRFWNRPVSLVLTPTEIEWHTTYGQARIPLEDIEAVEAMSTLKIRFAGLRLRRVDRVIDSMSPEMRKLNERGLPLMRIVAPLSLKFIAMHIPTGVLKTVTGLTGLPDMVGTMENAGNAKTIGDSFRLTRQLYGADVLFPEYDLDRKTEAFCQLLESYRGVMPGGGSGNFPP